MPVISAFCIFIAVIALLSLLRNRLVYELSGTSLLLFGSSRPGVMLYAIIFLPGTIVHELSHWIFAEILAVRTGEITILPDFSSDDSGMTRRLGSVATARSDPFRAFLIGIAPFLTGLGILAVLGRLIATGSSDNFAWWQLTLIIYGIVVVGNSMMTSREDRRTWPVIIVFIFLISLLLYRLRLAIPPSFWSLGSSILTGLDTILGVTAGLNLVMIVGLYGLRKLVEKLMQRRLV